MPRPHNPKRTFRCVNCGGNVRYNSGKGMEFSYNHESYPLENDVMMWICEKCGEAYLDEESCKDVDKELEMLYNRKHKGE